MKLFLKCPCCDELLTIQVVEGEIESVLYEPFTLTDQDVDQILNDKRIEFG